LLLVGVDAEQVDFVHQLEDGLLVLGGNSLRALTAEWTLVVAMDAPQTPRTLLPEISKLESVIDSKYVKLYIDSTTRLVWKHQLERLRVQVASWRTGRSRSKRSIFGFLDPVYRSVFGLATEKEIQECRQIIDESRKSEQYVTHKVNQLISVINHTRHYVQENRMKINDLVDYTQSLSTSLAELKSKLNGIGFMNKISVLFNSLQTIVDHQQNMKDHFDEQRASLELGRLTEELLPVAELITLLQKAASLHAQPVEPLEWYYQSVVVAPMWSDGHTMVYKAVLPLVDRVHYLRYTIKTWKIPYNSTGYSAQILTPKDMAIDTSRGTVFMPHSCIGIQPEVCRTGPQYDRRLERCPCGILIGEASLRRSCRIRIEHQDATTTLEEVQGGEYVLVTWGDACTLQCRNHLGIRVELAAGVYLLNVPQNCTVVGTGWTLTGILKRTVHTSVAARQVQDLVPFGLKQLIPEEHVAAHLPLTNLTRLPPVMVATVSELSVPPPVPMWNQGTTKSSWETILLVIVTCVLPVALLVWYLRSRGLSYVQSLICGKKPKDCGTVEVTSDPDEMCVDPGPSGLEVDLPVSYSQ
jgi:hypothetical protein